jgi:hypothetical protein|tara:strand:- start:250 stop:474 length:225 start_codon:yes stop_codon:yes gene_type:complete
MKIKVINTDTLSKDVIQKIETPMVFTRWWEENKTMFCELKNSKGEIIRIFPERIKPIDSSQSLDDITEVSREFN